MFMFYISWLVTALVVSSSCYEAPYVDLEGLPEMSYYQPGDINVAYISDFSAVGQDGRLCAGSSIDSTSYRSTEAAR